MDLKTKWCLSCSTLVIGNRKRCHACGSYSIVDAKKHILTLQNANTAKRYILKDIAAKIKEAGLCD
jgi:RNA polymerase subunit RPABC4/transcription elongation factor Spt4